MQASRHQKQHSGVSRAPYCSLQVHGRRKITHYSLVRTICLNDAFKDLLKTETTSFQIQHNALFDCPTKAPGIMRNR